MRFVVARRPLVARAGTALALHPYRGPLGAGVNMEENSWPSRSVGTFGLSVATYFWRRVMWQIMAAERHELVALIPASAQRRPVWSRKSGPGQASMCHGHGLVCSHCRGRKSRCRRLGRIVPGPAGETEHAWAHCVCEHRAGEAGAAGVINAHHVALGDSSPLCILGIDRDRFAAGDLARSADRPRVHLAVQAIARLARDQMKRILRC